MLRRNLPEFVTGYSLDDPNSFWKVTIPEESTNLILNPSIEYATTGFTNDGFTSIALSTDRASGGFSSLKLTPNGSTENRAYYTATVTAGVTYTWSVDIYGYYGDTLYLQIRDGSTVVAQQLLQPRYNGWARYSITWRNTLTSVRLVIVASAATPAGHLMYVDRLHLSAKSYVETYVDGDERPYAGDTNKYAFSWTGAPHESTSRRSQNTTGGKLVSLKDFGFLTTTVSGLEFGPIEPQYSGDNYPHYLMGVFRKRRVFTITGRLYGKTERDLQEKRINLLFALRPKWGRSVQPIQLHYQPITTEGVEYGIPLYITALCTDGLSGNFNNWTGEEFALIFEATDPYLYEVAGQDLYTLGEVYVSTNKDVVVKGLDGNFYELSTTNANGDVIAIAYMPNGDLVVGGTFTSINGVSATRVARWTGSAWSAIGSGLGGTVRDFWGYGVYIVAVGDFTEGVKLWDTGAWQSLGSGLNGVARSVVVTADNNIYAFGDFTASGATDLRKIARWNTVAWVEPGGSGFNGNIYEAVLGADGRIYFGGDFNQDHTLTVLYGFVGGYDPTSDSYFQFSTGLNSTVNSICFGPGGMLYVGGIFTGDWLSLRTINRISRWTGSLWEEVGGGLDGAVTKLGFDGRLLYVTGNFTNPITGVVNVTTDTTVCWDGYNWVSSPYQTGRALGGFALSNGGNFAIAQGDISGMNFFRMMQTLSVENTGTAESRPVFKFTNDTVTTYYITQISNFTTDQHIYFNAMPIVGGFVYVDLRQGIRVYSEFGVDLSRFVIWGASCTDDFRVAEGDNYIGVMATNEGVTCQVLWPKAHWSLDGAVNE